MDSSKAFNMSNDTLRKIGGAGILAFVVIEAGSCAWLANGAVALVSTVIGSILGGRGHDSLRGVAGGAKHRRNGVR